MSVNVKPIQSTPSLSGEDAKRIMLQVSTKPSKEAIKKWSIAKVKKEYFKEMRKEWKKEKIWHF